MNDFLRYLTFRLWHDRRYDRTFVVLFWIIELSLMAAMWYVWTSDAEWIKDVI